AAVIKPLIRHKTLFLSTFTTHSLTNALNRLEDNSASGKDGITVKKFKQKGAKWIEKISKEISPDYETKEIKRAYIPKKDNEKEYREIILYNLGDRVIHKAIALQINDTIERILSTISFAYRRGLDSKKALRSLQKEMEEGYNIAVKADIDDFFGSINCKTLVFLLEGLFPFEPLVRLINKILSDSHKLGINGISQGSPLSPILSNIYLDRFDRVVTDAGLRMIRYCDDFVVLLAKDSDEKEGIKKIEKFLERFELKLKREKIEITKSGGVINFLGHTVSNKVLKLKEKEPDTFLSLWNNGFQENWAEGSPIYLTTNCRGVFSNGAHLVVKTLGGENNNFCEKKVIWNNVSRITVIGRANYSGGVIQRAVKENIPITFIDIMGVVRGHIYPARYFFNDLERIQEKYATNEKASLEFAKRFIFGKVYNSNMVLKKYGINRKEFTESLEKIDKCEDMDSLRGYEGYAASIFFEELPKLIYPFEFEKRVYHPPEGEVNVMLSFGYTLLYNRIVAALKVAGFNERIGFFHQQHGRHACLASDLIEELRFVIDHFTISMIQKRLLEKKHFTDEQINKKRLWRLTGEGFRVYIKNFESTMNKNITYDGKKLSIYSYLDEMIENLKFALRMETQYEPLLVEKDDLHSSL
ncbi:MAG TPA: CRISPR-associated endonuclease Cas1, partial [Spirochaetota bacterium]|nr:CRISPR-associated endonuclease Cas1 [Spirochaetota bacterium]